MIWKSRGGEVLGDRRVKQRGYTGFRKVHRREVVYLRWLDDSKYNGKANEKDKHGWLLD